METAIGASVPFSFTLKNNGSSTISAASSTAVTLTDKTTYTSPFPD